MAARAGVSLDPKEPARERVHRFGPFGGRRAFLHGGGRPRYATVAALKRIDTAGLSTIVTGDEINAPFRWQAPRLSHGNHHERRQVIAIPVMASYVCILATMLRPGSSNMTFAGLPLVFSHLLRTA